MNDPGIFGTTFVTNATTGTITVAVNGDFESATVRIFEAATGRVVELAPQNVILDLSGTTLIDSAAIGAIMRFRRHLHGVDTQLRVDAPHQYQQRLFEITGISHILTSD